MQSDADAQEEYNATIHELIRLAIAYHQNGEPIDGPIHDALYRFVNALCLAHVDEAGYPTLYTGGMSIMFDTLSNAISQAEIALTNEADLRGPPEV